MKEKTIDTKWHTSAKVQATNLDVIPGLIAASILPTHSQSGIFWSGTRKVICHVGSLHPYPPEKEAIRMIKTLPPERCPGLKYNPFLIAPLPYASSIRTFHFIQLLRPPF